MSAPVKHTCPDIDSIIKRIKSASKKAWDMYKSTDKYSDENDAFREIENDLDGLDSEMERLRHSNCLLRDWGHEMEDRVYQLEKENEELKLATETA